MSLILAGQRNTKMVGRRGYEPCSDLFWSHCLQGSHLCHYQGYRDRISAFGWIICFMNFFGRLKNQCRWPTIVVMIPIGLYWIITIALEGRFGLSSDSTSVHFCFWHKFCCTWYNNKLGDSGTHDLNQRRICLQCGGLWGTQRYLCCWIGRLPNPTPAEFCMPNINTWRSIDS